MTRAAILLALWPLLTAASIDSRTMPAAPVVSVAGRAEFCAASPSLCAASGAGIIAADEATLALIRRVNTEVNSTMRQIGRRDTAWKVGAAEGDCEDFAATKLALLMKAGLPRRALRLAVVQVGSPAIAFNGNLFTVFDYHMVLTVETDAGTLVLDSLSPIITDWSAHKNWRWVAIEAERDSRMVFERLRPINAQAFEEVR
jgi:predicted transglutaminase-like cysteine proteinase